MKLGLDNAEFHIRVLLSTLEHQLVLWVATCFIRIHYDMKGLTLRFAMKGLTLRFAMKELTLEANIIFYVSKYGLSRIFIPQYSRGDFL